MLDFLVDHAVKNVWCTPDQDKQYIFKPQKVINPHGVLNRVVVMDKIYSLPTLGTKYHVYQIGHYHPELIGLPETVEHRWTNFLDVVNSRSMIVNIYNDSGIEILKKNCYYLWTREKALLIAIKEDNRIFPLYKDEIFIRVYSNAYYEKINSGPERVVSEYYNPITISDILNVQARFNYFKTLKGHVSVSLNGLHYSSFDLFTVTPGDKLEITYDPSVKKIIDFKIADLKTFTSSLDKAVKYLLHPNKDGTDTIEYMDDIDLYLVTESGLRPFGIYIHKNTKDTFRMLTHRDYSLKVTTIKRILLNLKLRVPNVVITDDKTYIRMIVRNSGYNRPLVFENNKIHELYKLPDELITTLMLDSNGQMKEWTASNLENSAYIGLMGEKPENITKALVTRTYGYNSVTKISADTPIEVKYGESSETPRLYQGNTVVYEYASDGTFLDFKNQFLSSTYIPTNEQCARVEFLKGKCGIDLESSQGTDEFNIRSGVGYRVYMTEEYPYNQISYNWRDVTDTNEYQVTDGKLVGKPGYYYVVRYEDRILSYDLQLDLNRGVLEFDIQERNIWNGVSGVRELMIPLGDLIIILNGKSLVEGIDYFVDFPTVRIVSKQHMTTTNNVHVRFSGFCSTDFSWNKSEDVGFVFHGKLSTNNVFDIRDDRVLRTVVGGFLLPTNKLAYAEDGLTTNTLSPLNGLPYEIRATYIPITNITDLDSEQLRIEAKLLDKKISDFLSYVYPQVVNDEPSASVSRYVLYSPFISRIIHDLKEGILDLDLLSNNYSDTEIIESLKSYESILKTDPLLEENRPDLDYVTIHPVVDGNIIELNLYQYRFIIRVVNIYAKDLVDLSPFIRLKEV